MLKKLNLKRAYASWVSQAKAAMPHEEAMKFAVGGDFEAFGVIESEMLRFYGLGARDRLIDVGCGSGRLAIPLSKTHVGPYLGTDLVPDLLAYARKQCARPDWRFEAVDGLTIPAADGSADMVCFFSVFTHLLHEQTYLYLEEARRVLKPGGKIVFSFLEFAFPGHWPVFESTIADTRSRGAHPLNVFIERDAIRAWAAQLDLRIVDLRTGDDHFVPLPAPLSLANGVTLSERANLGQSVCVLLRPHGAIGPMMRAPAGAPFVYSPKG